ncbi:hypothetical protein M404DRAFT_18901 [Pisolithus tinctorius Marx 270]|uniref:AMP-dependent synthetase/ligase domain-containing protein n=1 Tax=Pisolithus tinctorius Marx 270 TaxID=870435 RepID=A0A0C3PWX7_PISTI|nr:hypothetical protein M404DRAFT_18901 [Pisolithus tinctorius Marx 270]
MSSVSSLTGFLFKTVIDETKAFTEYLGEFNNALITSLAHNKVTYEDIVTEGKLSSTGRGYLKHLSGYVVLRFDNHLYTEDAARDLHVTIKDISVVTESEHGRQFKEFSSSEVARIEHCCNRIALTLIQQCVRHGDVITLCFGCGISLILSVLAVLKAGATLVPLDPGDPTLRKELMVEERCKRAAHDLEPLSPLPEELNFESFTAKLPITS